TPLWPALPETLRRFPGWGPNRVVQDQSGEWWIGTARGLFRFATAGARVPKAVYTKKDGLAGDHIFSLHEDAHGDLWIALAESQQGLCRWTRATGKFSCYSVADTEDPFKGNLISALAEDKAGDLWIG